MKDGSTARGSPTNPARTSNRPKYRKSRYSGGWHQTWKLSPQPQRPFSFGLVNVNPEVSAFVS